MKYKVHPLYGSRASTKPRVSLGRPASVYVFADKLVFPQVKPTDPIMLMANAVHEVHLTLRPYASGSMRYMYVNVVGILCYNNNNNNLSPVGLLICME